MKKLLLAVVILVTTIASAQKGSILLGGNVGYSTEKIEDLKSNVFEFSPKVGYQFTDNWTAGIEGSISSVKYNLIENGEKISHDSQAYKIGGFVRYAVPLSDLFSFYTDLGVGYQSDSPNLRTGMYASLTPALFINMKKGFGLNFSIGGINYDNLDGTYAPKEESFGFNFGKTLNIGISKNF